MKNSLVLWGPDSDLNVRLACEVSAKCGLEYVRHGSSLTGSPTLSVASHDELIHRERRLEVLHAATLVCVLPMSAAAPGLQDTGADGSYKECHLVLKVDPQGDLSSAVQAVVECLQRAPIGVGALDASYCVDVTAEWPTDRLAASLAGSSSILFMSDENVYPLHAAPVLDLLRPLGCSVSTLVVPAGEQHKTLATVETMWQRAQEVGLDRRGAIVALGGGVLSDMAGFAAAAWLRGITWVGLPTTLLAMVDASVGGKTAVDLGQAKNAIGAFWQPSAVVCNTRVLETEPERGYRGALAEVVKTALIGDPDLYTLLEREGTVALARDAAFVHEMVRRCVRVKARVVGLDAREGGLRAVLNLGHTLGHALEADGGYFSLSHGEAVSLGLVAALNIGKMLGVTGAELVSRTVGLLSSLGLPTKLDAAALRRAIQLLGFDKKRAGRSVSFVVLREIGDVRVQRLSLEELSRRTLELAGSLGG